jgi:hypothetical protein
MLTSTLINSGQISPVAPLNTPSSDATHNLVAKSHSQEIAMNFQFNGAYYSFTPTEVIVTSFIVVVVIAIVIAALVERRRTRTLAFRNRFGSEYDREVNKHGSWRQAEAKLADRETRVGTLEIRGLGVTEQQRFVSEWQTVQARFLDHPKLAVTEADDLVNALLEAQGYPVSGFEQRAADISVNYPRVMENYREAHGIAVRLGKLDASTEELRNAMIQYRTVFDELIQVHIDHHQVSAA